MGGGGGKTERQTSDGQKGFWAVLGLSAESGTKGGKKAVANLAREWGRIAVQKKKSICHWRGRSRK